MYRYPLIFAVVVILLIIGVFTIFGGHKSPKPTSTSTSQVQSLPSYASTDATTTMTIDGHINGDDIHRAIRITIGQNQRELDIIQGYSGHVIESHTYYNTQDAYNVFLRSINGGGFMLREPKSKVSNNELGQCPLGFRYVFDLSQNGQDLSRLWASSCGIATGTFGGNSQLIQGLFEAQIPQYQDIADNVEL